MPDANSSYGSVGQPDDSYTINLQNTGGAVTFSRGTNNYWSRDRILFPDDARLPSDTWYTETVNVANTGYIAIDGGTGPRMGYQALISAHTKGPVSCSTAGPAHSTCRRAWPSPGLTRAAKEEGQTGESGSTLRTAVSPLPRQFH